MANLFILLLFGLKTKVKLCTILICKLDVRNQPNLSDVYIEKYENKRTTFIFVIFDNFDFFCTLFPKKCAPILTFDAKLNQIAFIWPLLNSAKLSCSSEVTLP